MSYRCFDAISSLFLMYKDVHNW